MVSEAGDEFGEPAEFAVLVAFVELGGLVLPVALGEPEALGTFGVFAVPVAAPESGDDADGGLGEEGLGLNWPLLGHPNCRNRPNQGRSQRRFSFEARSATLSTDASRILITEVAT